MKYPSQKFQELFGLVNQILSLPCIDLSGQELHISFLTFVVLKVILKVPIFEERNKMNFLRTEKNKEELVTAQLGGLMF